MASLNYNYNNPSLADFTSYSPAPPVSRLDGAPELLAEIFRLCIPYGDVLPDARKPYNFTHVCQTWRYTSLSTPFLWSRFSLSGYNCKTVLEDRILDAWLRRSVPLPLTVQLCLYGCETSLECLWRNLVLLERHRQRWKNMVITMPYKFVKRVLESVGKKTPLLQSLTLIRTPEVSSHPYRKRLEEKVTIGDFDGPYQPWDLPRMPDYWHQAILFRPEDIQRMTLPPMIFGPGKRMPESLRSVTLESVEYIPNGSRNGISWNITNLTIQGIKLPISLELLRVPMPRLETLILSASGHAKFPNPTSIDDRISIPSLRELRIECDKLFGASNFYVTVLDLINAPSLERISLCTDKYLVDSQNNLSALLRRSRPPLTHLNISGLHIPEDDFIDALREVPTLRFFNTTSIELSDEFLLAITIPSSVDYEDDGDFIGLCPELVYLGLDIVGVNLSSDAIITMLCSRWQRGGREPMVCSMKRLGFATQKAVWKDVDIQRYLNEGMPLYI